MKIRIASFGDCLALSDLWETCALTRPWNNPAEDIKTALNTKGAQIFIGVIDDKIMASVMCGFDGHRGWMYYVAVHPDFQRQGYARKIIKKAENWLLNNNCPKVELILRHDNIAVQEIYEKLGYAIEPRTLMSKWLKTLPISPTENTPQIHVARTYLEMTERPTKPLNPMPSLSKPVSLTRVQTMSVNFFRFLYNSVGEQWMWWEKRCLSDRVLLNFINRDGVEFYTLNVGGAPAGFVQLTFFPASKNGAEISYFGLLPDFIGMKLGPYLLDWAVEICWTHPTKPERVFLDTCTLDHPSALVNYQKSGFVPYNQETFTIPDPRACGIIPKHIVLAQPEPAL